LEPKLQALRRQGIVTDVCPILKTPDEANRTSPLYLDLVEDAMILHERNRFFSAILERLRASLRRLGARRIRRGHVRYWELKPDYVPGEVFICEVSFYGDEEVGAAPQQLYAEPDARMALDDAGYVLQQCRRLIGQ